MAKYRLVTGTCWAGTDKYHDIAGDFVDEVEALKAFGGAEDAWQQAIDDHGVSYHVEKVED